MSHSTKKLALTGCRFGKLTVLTPAENVGSRTAWLCRCNCGQEIIVTTVQLRGGHRTSCGCDKEPHDVIGRASLTYVGGTCVEMLRAKTVRSNNTSGVTGVEWIPRKHSWRASICFKGKRYYLGSYHSFEEAVKARKRGEEQFHDTFLREFDEQQQKSTD